jgi:hypothetical protein
MDVRIPGQPAFHCRLATTGNVVSKDTVEAFFSDAQRLFLASLPKES